MSRAKGTIRVVIIYAGALALGAFALEWLQYQYVLKVYTVEIYIFLIATAFAGLGIWLGKLLTPGARQESFERNDAALKSLQISPRELEVLEALATGQSNKEMARELGISPNTIKTHIARLYEKLEVDRRVVAIEKARSLSLIA